MANEFDKYKTSFTRKELNAASVILRVLPNSRGKLNAVNLKRIKDGLLQKYGMHVNTAQISRLIRWLRTSLQLKNIIQTRDGYHVSTNLRELQTYRDSLAEEVRERKEIMIVIDADIRNWHNEQEKEEELPF